MTKKNQTKRALISSVIALVLCFSMLVGTTFAWFTDSVSSAKNKIVAGNLDVELEWSTDMVNWETLDTTTNVFSATYWEPGHTEVVYLRISNQGSLALKYQLGVNIVSETPGTNVEDKPFQLSDFIKYDIVDVTAAYASREAAVEAAINAKVLNGNPYVSETAALAAVANDVVDSDTVALIVYMPETVGNEANYKTGTVAPSITLGINLVATQKDAELDSFDEKFDQDAVLPEINSAVITGSESNGTVLKPAENHAVSVTVPAGATSGTYTLEVSNPSETTDAEGNTTVAYEIELLRDGVKASGENFTVQINVGENRRVTEVTHNGAAVQNFTYDMNTGIVEFTTTSFSPFAICFNDGKVDTYAELDEYFKAGGYVQLAGDIVLESQSAQTLLKPVYNRESYCGLYVPDDVTVVLELNGHTLSYVDTYGDVDNLMIINLGNFTVNDSVGGGKISYKPVASTSQYSKFYSTVFNCGTLTVNGGTIENICETDVDVTNAVDNHSRLSHEYANDCILTVNGGALIGSEYYAVRQYTHYLEGVKNRVTINGGTVVGGIYMQHGESWYYADPAKNRLNVDGYLTINGGTITTLENGFGRIRSRLNNPDNAAWGLEINGGIIDVEVELLVQRGVYYTNGVSGATTPAEAAGTRTAEWLAKNGGFVKGGTFTEKCDFAYIAKGYGFATDSITGAIKVVAGPLGYPSNAYTSETTIWGECGAKATESFELKIYSGDTYLGESSLNNIGGIIDGDLYVTWSIMLDAEANTDEYWTMTWETAPTLDLQPTKVVLCADGVDIAESPIYLWGPDNLNKLVAIVTDANGRIVRYATSLTSAVANVPDGGTVTLIDNFTFTAANRTHNSGSWYDGIYYVGDKSFTIDLNGYTISNDSAVNDYLLNFKNVGEKANVITIKNGTVDATSSAYCAICTSSSSTQKITINLENVKMFNNISNGSTAKIRGGAELNVKAGTIITGKNSYLAIECVASTVNIYDGAEIYQNGTSSYNGCLAGACYGGTINVYGGYGKGAKGGFIAMTSGGTINVYGGEWIANTDGTVGDNSNLYILTAQSNVYESGFVGPSIINVFGGTLRGGMDAWVLNNKPEEKAKLNIKGGTFNADPTRYAEEGFSVIESEGEYSVMNVVTNETELAAAIKNGGVVALANNIELTNTISFDKVNATIYGNGYSIKPAATFAATDSAFNLGQGNDNTVITRRITFKDIVFDGWTTDHVVRCQGLTAVIEGCKFINCKQPDGLGLLTLTFSEATVRNCEFKNNECVKAIDINSWGDNSKCGVVIEGCIFENNKCNTTAVVYYNNGAGATINGNKFVNNTVTVTGSNNAATLYMGFTKNNVITNNVFENNTVNVGTSKRVAGGVMLGYEAVFTGNAFVGNTVNGANAKGNDVCASVYYTDIDLSGNYWGGSAPVENDDYFVEYTNHKVIINDYLTSYEG